eukprot:15367126-Ditylum_brightwellii.AAC.1
MALTWIKRRYYQYCMLSKATLNQGHFGNNMQGIFICCQVDDFKVARPDEDIIQDLINKIWGKIKLTIEKKLLKYYNGIDYEHTCDYIQMHTKTYLTKILKNHGWECGSKEEDKIIKSIHPDSIKELETTTGPLSEAESNPLKAEDEKADQLAIYVDAAHATDIKCKQSMGGALFAGTAIAYTTKWQITMVTSSTEAEFIQAISVAKMAKYLQTVLNELDIQQCEPTTFCEDNAAAIMMAYNNKPNGWTQHIIIKYFSLQEWVTNGKVKLAHICGVTNPTDALAKALGGHCIVVTSSTSWDTWEQSIPTL